MKKPTTKPAKTGRSQATRLKNNRRSSRQTGGVRAVIWQRYVGIAGYAIVFAVVGVWLLNLSHAASITYGPIKAANGMCLDTPNNSTASGTKVQVWTCNGDFAQSWHAFPDGTIRNHSGMCLDNTANSSTSGAKVQIWSCNNGNAQRWQVYANGISAKATGLVLDLTGNSTKSGTLVQVWQSLSDFAQQWTVVNKDYDSSRHLGDVGLAGGSYITRGGKVFMPYGMGLSGLQYPWGDKNPGTTSQKQYLDGPGAVQFSDTVSILKSQIDASITYWHVNTIRFQVEQDAFVNGGTGGTAADFLSKLRTVVSYAQSKGLIVVINPQTEPGHKPLDTADEPLPTDMTYKMYQILAPYYAQDKSVIFDIFNEPRPVSGWNLSDPNALPAIWNLWHDGGTYNFDGGNVIIGPHQYYGMQQLVTKIRQLGFQNQLWVQTAPGDLKMVLSNPSKYKISDPLNDVVYTTHHTTNGGVARTDANWDAEFGNVVKKLNLPVTDDEWTNRTLNSGNVNAAGDSGQCWGDAPTSVPRYFNYLSREGIGLTGWTLGALSDGGTVLNAYGGGFGSGNSYPTSGYSCVTGTHQGVWGAGQDIQAWFAQQAK